MSYATGWRSVRSRDNSIWSDKRLAARCFLCDTRILKGRSPPLVPLRPPTLHEVKREGYQGRGGACGGATSPAMARPTGCLIHMVRQHPLSGPRARASSARAMSFFIAISVGSRWRRKRARARRRKPSQLRFPRHERREREPEVCAWQFPETFPQTFFPTKTLPRNLARSGLVLSVPGKIFRELSHMMGARLKARKRPLAAL